MDLNAARPWERVLWPIMQCCETRGWFQRSNDYSSVASEWSLKATISGSFGSRNNCKYKESRAFWIKPLKSVFDDLYCNDLLGSLNSILPSHGKITRLQPVLIFVFLLVHFSLIWNNVSLISYCFYFTCSLLSDETEQNGLSDFNHILLGVFVLVIEVQ